MSTIRRWVTRPITAFAAIATVAASLATTAVGLPAGATPSQVPPVLRSAHWYIDADTLHVANADEDDWLSNGDEPMIAVVAFRTKLGVPGSTQAWKLNGLHELCDGDPGVTCGIPDATGRAYFGNVRRPSLADMGAGVGPELIGTIQVTIENDATPESTMNSIIDTLVDATRTELAAASETLVPDDFADLSRVTSRFDGIGDRIQSRTELSFWQKLGIWLSSWSDPDDPVDYRITLMVGVHPDLADPVNLALLAAFYQPGSKISAAVLGTRNLTLPHQASGVHYNVAERIFYQWQ
jgi:hypothetical protein